MDFTPGITKLNAALPGLLNTFLAASKGDLDAAITAFQADLNELIQAEFQALTLVREMLDGATLTLKLAPKPPET